MVYGRGKPLAPEDNHRSGHRYRFSRNFPVRRLGRQKLDEAQPRAAFRPRADLDLVRESADDRDSEAALLQLAVAVLRPLGELEPRALVADLDGQPVGLQLV